MKKLSRAIENAIRGWFSKKPLLYGFVAGVGTVLFWRGVWHTADSFAAYVFAWQSGNPTTDLVFPLDGLMSFLVGTLLLLASGVFVSTFLGNEITISGLRGERKLSSEIETEVRTETGALHEIRAEVRKMRRQLEQLGAKSTEGDGKGEAV